MATGRYVPGSGVPAGRRRAGHAEVYAALCALSFLAARCLPLLALPYTCPFKALTGLPCATCGMTHAFVHLAHGQVGAAFGASPLGATLAALAWAFVVVDAARLAAAIPWPRVDPRAASLLARAGVAAVVANWLFLVLSQRA